MFEIVRIYMETLTSIWSIHSSKTW